MLKKSLLALAITATAFTGAANAAASIAILGNADVALEGNQTASLGGSKLQSSDLGNAANQVILTTGTAYIINDLLVFTVSGATFDTTVTPTATNATTAASKLNFVDFSDSNTVRFRISGANGVAADKITLDSYTLKTGTAVDKTKVAFASNAISVNPLIGNYDAVKGVTAFTFTKQVANKITGFNGEVSTGKGRAEFTTTGSHASLQDVLKIETTDESAAIDAITVTKITNVIKGDFSWVMDYDLTANSGNANGKLDSAEIARAFTTTLGAAAGTADTVVYTIDNTLSTLTATHNVNAAIDASVSVEVNTVGNALSGSVITAPQSFTLNTTVSNGTVSYALPEVSAGKFTLDGSTTSVAFLPYGANYAQSVTVTNRGAVEGAITVDVSANGEKHSKVLTAVSSAKSVTDISGEVKALVAEKFGADFEGNVSLSIITNAPSIEATALYFAKSDADRVLVQSK